jgi:hypothetical protein
MWHVLSGSKSRDFNDEDGLSVMTMMMEMMKMLTMDVFAVMAICSWPLTI